MRVFYGAAKATIASGKSVMPRPVHQILHAANRHMEKSTEWILDSTKRDAGDGLLFV